MGNDGASQVSTWDALTRRKLVHWALAYVAGAWLVLQATSLIAGVYGWPPATMRVLVGAVIVGFPVALVLAWYHGERGQQRVGAMELALLTTLLALGAGMLWRVERGSSPVSAASTATATAAADTAPVAARVPRKSIAVLPFTDLSRSHDQEYFSDGMAEEILSALSRVADLKVAGRTSSFQFKGRNADLRAIGRELGVAHILEGSVRKQGKRVRITAQLIQAEDGFHLWSETYDGELSDVFQLQERIARAITGELQVILLEHQQQRLVPVATTNPEAYSLFLQATSLYNRREDDLGAAVAALEEALRLDPQFARAQARLAAVQVVWTSRGAAGLELTETHARKAIALDPTLAEPWAVLGRMHGEQRNFMQAREAFAHALALEPDDATTNYWYAVALITTGYTREGRARLDRAIALDPLQPNAQLWVGLEASYAGDQEAAQRAIQRAADMGLAFASYGLSELAHARGDNARALAIMLPRYQLRMAECGIAPQLAERTLAGVLGDDPKGRADALVVIDRCLATRSNPTPFWAVKSLLYLDQPARVLEVARPQLTNNETFLFEMLWSPYGKSTRRLPEFAEFARATGLAPLWDRYGAPDACHRDADGDYRCE